MRWFDIEYREAKDFIFTPMKWFTAKIVQLTLQLYFTLLKALFMIVTSISKNGFNFLKKVIQKLKK